LIVKKDSWNLNITKACVNRQGREKLEESEADLSLKYSAANRGAQPPNPSF
jgi:hypothetical protein